MSRSWSLATKGGGTRLDWICERCGVDRSGTGYEFCPICVRHTLSVCSGFDELEDVGAAHLERPDGEYLAADPLIGLGKIEADPEAGSDLRDDARRAISEICRLRDLERMVRRAADRHGIGLDDDVSGRIT